MNTITIQDIEQLKSEYDLVYAAVGSNDDKERKLRHEVQNRISALTMTAELHNNAIPKSEQKSMISTYLDAKEMLSDIQEHTASQTESFDLGQIIDEVITSYQRTPKIKKVPVEKVPFQNMTIHANKKNTKGALYNFLTNVSRYSNSPVAEIKVQQYDGQVGISVIDYGTNPALQFAETEEASREHIFKKGTSGGKGHGDAMYLLKKDLNACGGDIEVVYAFPQAKFGTNFQVIVPYEKKD